MAKDLLMAVYATMSTKVNELLRLVEDFLMACLATMSVNELMLTSPLSPNNLVNVYGIRLIINNDN